MDVIFEVVQSFMCVIEVYLMFDFYMAFFSLKGRFQNKYGRAVIVLLTAACVRMVNSLDSSMINIVAMQIIYISLLFGLFYGNVLKKISCYLVGTAIMIGSELLWVILMAVPSDFSMEHIKNTKISVYMSLLGAKIIAFILFNIAKRRAKESYNKMEIKNFLLYSIVPLATLGIMVSLAYLDIDFDSIRFVQFLLILCSILSVIGDILNFYVFDRFSASIEKLRRQDVVITKMEMEERRYEQIEAVNQEHARFLHDIRHYMRAIGAMASENHDEEILDILSQLQVKISDAEIEMYCPNRLLNTILNEKKRETAEKGIDFELKIEPDFRIDQVENMDLIVIMGNLLDNAIEAAAKCGEGFVKIYLFSQNNASFSVIKIVNNYVGEIKIKNAKIQTIKEDKTKHGFGIQNVAASIEKYGGNLQNFYEDNKFTAVVLLPNP